VSGRASIDSDEAAVLAELRQVTRRLIDSLAHQQSLIDEMAQLLGVGPDASDEEPDRSDRRGESIE
jgi:hypothetical protein